MNVHLASFRLLLAVIGSLLVLANCAVNGAEAQGVFARAAESSAPDFSVKLEPVMKHDDGKFLWFHPRAAAIPGRGQAGPAVVMTIQKHLKISDYYSGLHVMRAGATGCAVDRAVAAARAGLAAAFQWRHHQRRRCHTRLARADGETPRDRLPGPLQPERRTTRRCDPRAPDGLCGFRSKTDRWSPWQVLELPPDEWFNFARNACSQWLVQPDGQLLVPLYIGRNSREPFSTTVAECRFDGTRLTYVRHGSVLKLNLARGLYEPSLIAFRGRYFLTLRNDERGYVSVSNDGLQFAEPKPWLFDDGTELGSYNTQQHWLAHSDGLFLIYTRRGANNDHIVRHRAPLFMAQVDPATLQVIRRTEKVVVPERGAELGNFGATAISESESWITVSEGMFMKDSRERGAEGATFVARVIWAKPNRLVEPSLRPNTK